MKKHLRLFCLLSLLSIGAVEAQEEISFFDLLSEDELIEVRLTTDLKKLVRNKMETGYQDGDFHFLSGPLAGTSYAVKIRPRGNMRKQVCYYPPIKIKFSKESGLRFRKIKWVNVCRDNRKMEQLLLKEFLIYKLYQQLTDYAYEVRLFKVSYHKASDQDPLMEHYAFALEPEKELNHRTGTKSVKPTLIRPRILERRSYIITTLFEYLIGNMDWSVTNKHNVSFAVNRELQEIHVIPYDFDYSGTVNAGYAVPPKHINVDKVTNRHNMAHCMTEEELYWGLDYFNGHKEQILTIIQDFPFLDQKEQKTMHGYIESGFKQLSRKKDMARVFTKRQCFPCKGCKVYEGDGNDIRK